MIEDISTIVWKEWKETLFQRNISRSEKLARLTLAIVVLAILLWRSGPLILSTPQAFMAPSLLPLFFLIAIVADSFAGERERHTLETLLASRLPVESILLGKLFAAVSLIWAIVFFFVTAVVVSTGLMARGKPLTSISIDAIVPFLLFYCLLTLVIGCAGILVSLRASGVRHAMQIMNIGMVVVFFTLIYTGSMLPIEWKRSLARAFGKENLFHTEVIVDAILLVLSLMLFVAARLRFKRDRLLLD